MSADPLPRIFGGLSPPQSPRQSDISFSSVRTTLSSAPSSHARKHSISPPPSTDLPAHASTSTISRESDARPPTRPSSVPTFPEPLSQGRIPKGRVFVHRDPDRLRPGVPPRPLTPAPPRRHTGPTPPLEKRCVSDLHDFSRRLSPPTLPTHRAKVGAPPVSSSSPLVTASMPRVTPVAPRARRPVADLAAARVRSDLVDAAVFLAQDPAVVPPWIPPHDEVRDWGEGRASSDDADDLLSCSTDMDEEVSDTHSVTDHRHDALVREEDSRWTNSLRNITNLYKLRDRPPPCIRGSVLEIQPPTLTERFGLLALADRKKHSIGATDRPRNVRKPRPVSGAAAAAAMAGASAARSRPLVEDSPRADEYVGFLVEADTGSGKAVRKGWLRFMRRKRPHRV